VMTPTLLKEVFQLNCQIIADPISGTPLCVPIGRKHQVRVAHMESKLPAMTAQEQPILMAAG